MQQDSTVKMTLIEMALPLPGVRAGVDHDDQARRALAVVRVWYTYLMEEGVTPPTTKQRRTRSSG